MFLSLPSAASADWQHIQPSGGGTYFVAVANAQTWLVNPIWTCCVVPRYDLTEDGGATWTQVEVPTFGSIQIVGAADDGTFRLVATRHSGADNQETQVFTIGPGGKAEPLGPALVGKSPLYENDAVSGDGSTWIPHWDPAQEGFVLSVVAADGSVATISLPQSSSTYGWEARRTVLGMRLLRYVPNPEFTDAYARETFRLEASGEVAPAERYPVSLKDGEWVLSSEFAKGSWDGGAHWSAEGVQVIPRAPAGEMPRFVDPPRGMVAERYSSFLFRETGLEPPVAEFLRVVDAGSALIAWGSSGIYVYETPLPQLSQAIGDLQPDTQQILARADLFRADAGLPPLTGDALISTASRNHSNYTKLNPEAAENNPHDETPGLPGFTGLEPWDRCEAVGTRCNSEIMYGPGVTDPVAGWLATVYHRPLLGSPEAGIVGAAEVPGGWAVADGGDFQNVLVAPFGYPTGRWRGESGFTGEIPDPVKGCQEAGQPISYPVGIAVSLYIPGDEGEASAIEVRRQGDPTPLPGCLLRNAFGLGKPMGAFVLDDPLVKGQTYEVTATWNPGPDSEFGDEEIPGPQLSYSWNFHFNPDAVSKQKKLCRALGLRTIRSVASRHGGSRRTHLGIEEKVVLKQKARVRLRRARLEYWKAGHRYSVRLKLGSLARRSKVVGRTSYLRFRLPPRVVGRIEPGEAAELILAFDGRRLRGCATKVRIDRIRKIEFGWVRLRGAAMWVSGKAKQRR